MSSHGRTSLRRDGQRTPFHNADEFTTSGTVKFFERTSTTNPRSGCARSSGVRLF